MTNSLAADLRLALRGMARRPGFTALAMATIGLGIGATSAVFSVIKTVLLDPLPYAAPGSLVTLHTERQHGGLGDWISGPEIADMRAVPGLSGVAAYNHDLTLNLTGEGEPERLVGTAISGDMFALLGIEPALGRGFTAEEDLAGGPDAVILSHGLWRRRFGADPAVVGRVVQMNGTGRTVVGVTAPGFALPFELRGHPADAWIPLRLDPAALARGSHFLYAVGRLRPGVTGSQLADQLDALSRRLAAEGRYHSEEQFRLVAVPARDYVVGGVRPILLLLLGAVAFVLLIACVNVANLLVERAEGRRREFAVRSALGADRGRLLQQLLVEHVTIAVMGGAAGLVLAAAGVSWLVSLAPDSVPRIREVRLDGGAIAATVALTALCALLFGLAPLLHAARHDPAASLGSGGNRTTMSRPQQRLRQLLVSTELALAIVLLAGASLTLRTFSALLDVAPGFEPRGVLTLRTVPPATTYAGSEQVAAFYQELQQRVRALPGVEQAGAVRVLPLAAAMGDWTMNLEGRVAPPGQDFDGDWQIVTPGYFEAMRVPLRAGRLIAATDVLTSAPVAVINETMAREYWPGGDAIGKRFTIGGPDTPWIEIVGIVGDERSAALDAPVNRRWFRPHAQWAQGNDFPIRGMTLVVRTAGDPLALAGPVREVVRGLDPALPVAEVRTLESVVAGSVARQRFTMLLLAVFAGAALVLAAVGVYGVLAYWVTERTREISVRLALGADKAEVAALVVGQALRPALIGIAAGGALALALTRLMRGLLFGVPPHDPLTFAAAPLLLLAVALLASWLPAVRAMGQEPAEALRSE